MSKSREPKCNRHPTYKVLKAPRSECAMCWIMWLARGIAQLQYRNHIADLLQDDYF